MNFMNVIANRQSCRAFSNEMIQNEELEMILQAANAAPVGYGSYENVQLTVIQDPDLIAQLEENAYQVNSGLTQHPLYGASTVIAISCKKEDTPIMAMANASTIAENMMLCATHLELGSVYLMAVPMIAQANPALCAAMKVQEGFAPYVMVGVGKPQQVLKERELTTQRIQTEYVR